MRQETQYQPVNRIGDFYSQQTQTNNRTQSSRTDSSTSKFDTIGLEDFARIAIALESIFRLSSGMGSSRAFTNPVYMLAAGSLMSNWLGPIISSNGSRLDGSLERSLQKPPSFNSSKTLSEQVAEADAQVVKAKANRKAVRTDAMQQAKSVLEANGHKVSKKSTPKKKEAKLSKKDRAERDLEFNTAIREAKGDVAASTARYKIAKAGNTTEKELAGSEKQLTKTKIQLAALEHARDSGLSVAEAKIAASTILSKMDGIDTAMSETKVSTQTRTGNWFTGMFKSRTTKTESRDIPSAYSAIATNYEDIERTLTQFGSTVLRQTVENSPHYSQAREIHEEASKL